MSEAIEIRTAKWKGYLALGVSLLWLSLVALSIFTTDELQDEISDFLFEGLLLFGLMYYSIYLIRKRKPVITINNSSLIWHISKPITIPLEQIAKVRLQRRILDLFLFFIRTIEISLRDRDLVLPPKTAIQKRVARLAEKMSEFHIMIPVFGLDKRPKEIYELIRQRAGLPIEPE